MLSPLTRSLRSPLFAGLEEALNQEEVKKWITTGLHASTSQGMSLRYSIGLFSKYDDQLTETYKLLAEKAKAQCDLCEEDVRIDEMFIEWAARLEGSHLQKEGGREKVRQGMRYDRNEARTF